MARVAVITGHMVAPAVMATGLENNTVCQPLAPSPLKVAVANGCPSAVHRLPVCVPVLAALL